MNLDLARIGVWLTSRRVQVVLCEYLQVAMTVADLCHRLNIPVIGHAHGFDLAMLPRVPEWADTYRKQLPRLAEIVVVSNHMREQVLRYGVAPAKVHVVPCGTPALDATTGHDASRLGADACQPDRSCFKVVAVGRLIAKKGPMFLLEAYRRIRATGVSAELFIIGDGPFREPMTQWIAASEWGSAVHLLGEQPNSVVFHHLRGADLFLQHSVTADDGDQEGLPVSILEAMAVGVPVVSTRHAGIPEAVTHGETGLLVEPGDSGGMADAACDLLRDDALRTRMRAAARDAARARFSLDRQIGSLRGIIEKYMT